MTDQSPTSDETAPLGSSPAALAAFKAKYRERTYRVVRMYFRGGKRVIRRGLTLAQAEAHCSDPETSSSTCTTLAGKRRTAQRGPWFDGYDEEK